MWTSGPSELKTLEKQSKNLDSEMFNFTLKGLLTTESTGKTQLKTTSSLKAELIMAPKTARKP